MGEWKGGNTNRLNEQRGSDSPHLNLKNGGGNEIRTHDLCSAMTEHRYLQVQILRAMKMN